jgi:hypothetical protein
LIVDSKETRKFVNVGHSINSKGMLYIQKPSETGKKNVGRKVDSVDETDGSIGTNYNADFNEGFEGWDN